MRAGAVIYRLRCHPGLCLEWHLKLCRANVRNSASSVPVALPAHFPRDHLKDSIKLFAVCCVWGAFRFITCSVFYKWNNWEYRAKTWGKVLFGWNFFMKKNGNRFLLKKSSIFINVETKIAAQYWSTFRSQNKPSGNFLSRKVKPSQEGMEQAELESNPHLKLCL